MLVQLKCCPFCGEDRPIIATQTEEIESGCYYHIHSVHCPRCEAGITGGDDQEMLIKRWNTRFEPTLLKRIHCKGVGDNEGFFEL